METLKDAVRRAAAPAVIHSAAIRRRLHTNPELSGQEAETSALVAQRLREIGVDAVQEHLSGYGIVAEIVGGGASKGPVRTMALRADMDALPIQEENDVAYRSCRPGVMHACGHDGHTAILLGAAEVLTAVRPQFCGRVRLIFQPAEENAGGAEGMCAAGAMEDVDTIAALHGWPGLEIGQIALRDGPFMASMDTFDLEITGKGSHAAMPNAGVDPIAVGAQIITALQNIVSREISPVDSAVVTVSQFHAGTTYNVIPSTAMLNGTVRCLSSTMRVTIPERIERIVAGICKAFRADYTFKYEHGTPVTVNDARVNAQVQTAARELLGAENVLALDAPSMSSEDFAEYLAYAPGAMFRLGVGARSAGLHSPHFDFPDAAIPVGIELFSLLSLNALQSGDRA